MRRSGVVLLLSCVLLSSGTAQHQTARLDSSDWWSYTRQEELPPQGSQPPIEFQKREPAETNFQLAGISLGEKWDFSDVRSKLGAAVNVERGDAASYRDQICYRSSNSNLHLIFELGEVDSVLYLFAGGPKWSGSEFCALSQTDLTDISTASGLRLGLGRKR